MEAALKRAQNRKRASARAKHRIGRPMKDPSGKRDQVTILLRAEVKRALIKAAQDNGRTLSQEGEHWFERLLQYEQGFAQMKANLDRLKQITIDGEFLRLGYMSVDTVHGKIWFPPGLPPDKFFKWERIYP